jgi:hypothetical protein
VRDLESAVAGMSAGEPHRVSDVMMMMMMTTTTTTTTIMMMMLMMVHRGA